MNCINCEYRTGEIYTSYPPKCRCSITGKLHKAYNDCDIENNKADTPNDNRHGTLFAKLEDGEYIKVDNLIYIDDKSLIEGYKSLNFELVVRCRDCEYWDSDEQAPELGYCDLRFTIKDEYVQTWHDEYCSSGERKK